MALKLNLSIKVSLVLLIVFVLGTLASSVVLWQGILPRAQAEIRTRGSILIETMASVRTYTSTHIKPLLNDQIATTPKFIAETVPAFSAKQVFETFRKNADFADFTYREATNNPTNLSDKPDEFGADLINQMKSQPDQTQLSGFRTLNNQQVYYVARPLTVSAQSCLACHSDPAVAPKSLIATYGAQNGFGWKLNDIIGSQILYVPAEQVFTTAQRAFLTAMLVIVGVFVLALLVLNFLLRRYVIRPVSLLGNLAHNVGTDAMTVAALETAQLQQMTKRTDELGDLSMTFQRMARDVYERETSLKHQVQVLNIEIDEMKKNKQVAEIVESDFFKDLQAKATEARRHSHRFSSSNIPSTPRSS